MTSAVSELAPVQHPLPPPQALPPHIAPVTPDDPDGDGDNDTGTIVDTFA
ncbi:MAG: hypothetical protein JO103_08345 [Candidatus Eremiobacteraeota bacterium]|nr:hypothetical protein [Candidatus Eremiobacteraeota bacterium]